MMVCVALSACAPSSTGETNPTKPVATQWKTSAEGRLKFGCALERGLASADATREHYTDLIAHDLFISGFTLDPGTAGAQLWNASDALVDGEGGSPAERAALLKVCDRAGMDTSVQDLDVLARYMCQLNEELAEKRPHVTDFGPEMKPEDPGDVLRNDPHIISGALLLLTLKDDWELPAVDPLRGLASADDATYRAGLRAVADLC